MNFIRTPHTLLLSSLSQMLVKPKVMTRLPRILSTLQDMNSLPMAAQMRHQHTVVTPGSKESMSTLQKLKWDLGFHGKLLFPKRLLKVAGFNLYVCCTDFIDFNEFVQEAKIPDTFNAWYLLLQLHMWLLLIKLNQMGKEGILLTQFVYQSMWVDIERRLNTFQELLASEKRYAMKDFHSIMCSSILYYDEGLLSSDQTLANSLWVQLYGMDPNIKAQDLELMVEYVRKQVHHLDNLDPMPVMKPGYVSFLPLVGDRLNQAKCDVNKNSLLKP